MATGAEERVEIVGIWSESFGDYEDKVVWEIEEERHGESSMDIRGETRLELIEIGLMVSQLSKTSSSQNITRPGHFGG